METGKVINRISNRLRRRSAALQETLGMSGAQGNILNFILVEGQKHSIYQKDIEKEFGLSPSIYGYRSIKGPGKERTDLPCQ